MLSETPSSDADDLFVLTLAINASKGGRASSSSSIRGKVLLMVVSMPRNIKQNQEQLEVIIVLLRCGQEPAFDLLKHEPDNYQFNT